ncbi:serine/threonine protein kinase [Nostoc sp. UHCC 0702]|nr:serine/threonine protein kinase [Nostoc sp. UHCC 0702]
MCSGFADNQQYLEPLEENSNSELDKSDTLLNGRYRILEPLGQGGFGKTFLALDEKYLQNSQSFDYSTSNFCVIKQFLPRSQNGYYNQKAFELFQQESLLLAELAKHSQIPQLLNTFEQEGQQYLVEEWVDGQNLEQELAEAGTFNEADIRQLLGELLPLLQFLHTHQVIHRDIKPANIIRRRKDRQLFLVDFGIAKYNWQNLKTGTMIGSAEYAAPEQVRGKAEFASDLYSLGVTCLYLLTQMSPFDLYDCSENVWIWRSYLVEPISPSLEKILWKLVQPAIRLRYHFAAEALIDLNNLAKQFDGSSTFSANTDMDEENFETPYFGLKREADLLASVTSFADSSVASVTIFDPKTRIWHYIPAKTEGAELARKVAAFLAPRLAAAEATPPLQETKLTAVDQKTRHKLNKMYQIIVTAIAFTITCLALVLESNSISTNLKVEISRIFQQFMNIGQKEKPLH